MIFFLVLLFCKLNQTYIRTCQEKFTTYLGNEYIESVENEWRLFRNSNENQSANEDISVFYLWLSEVEFADYFHTIHSGKDQRLLSDLLRQM